MEKNSRLRIDKELGVIDKIVPKIIPDNSEVVPYQVENGDDIEKDYEYQREKDEWAVVQIKDYTQYRIVGGCFVNDMIMACIHKKHLPAQLEFLQFGSCSSNNSSTFSFLSTIKDKLKIYSPLKLILTY